MRFQIKTALSDWSFEAEAESTSFAESASTSSSSNDSLTTSVDSIASSELSGSISMDVEPARKRNRAHFNLFDMFGEPDQPIEQSNSKEELISIEIAAYNAMRVANECDSHLNFDILSWWHKNELQLPTMSRFARFIHAIPATSAPSERSFSAAGNVYNEKRSSMTPDTLNSILLLRSNWDIAELEIQC